MTDVIVKTPGQALTESLARETPPDQIARVLREAMSATTVSRSGAVEPDHRTRLQACDLAIKMTVGLPVQRSEAVNVNLDADSAVSMQERLAHSPALRAMFRKMLAQADSDGMTPEDA